MLDTDAQRGQRWLTVIFIARHWGRVRVLSSDSEALSTGQGPTGNAIIQAGNIEIHVYPGDFYRSTFAAQQEDACRNAIQGFSLDSERRSRPSSTPRPIRRLTENAILAHAASARWACRSPAPEIQPTSRPGTIPGFSGTRDGRFLTEAAFENVHRVQLRQPAATSWTGARTPAAPSRKMLLALILRPAGRQRRGGTGPWQRNASLEAVRLGFVALDSEKLPPEQPLEEVFRSRKALPSCRTTRIPGPSTSYEREGRPAISDPRRAKPDYIVMQFGSGFERRSSEPAARARAEQVHQRILDGADFADVALEHSDDEASRARAVATSATSPEERPGRNSKRPSTLSNPVAKPGSSKPMPASRSSAWTRFGPKTRSPSRRSAWRSPGRSPRQKPRNSAHGLAASKLPRPFAQEAPFSRRRGKPGPPIKRAVTSGDERMDSFPGSAHRPVSWPKRSPWMPPIPLRPRSGPSDPSRFSWNGERPEALNNRCWKPKSSPNANASFAPSSSEPFKTGSITTARP